MTETPRSFAGTPAGANTSGADLLSDLLRAVRLSGAVFLNAKFTAPFGVISPRRFDSGVPMAHMRHVSVFHLVAAGHMSLQTISGTRHELGPGDVVLLPFPNDHTLMAGEPASVVHAKELWAAGPSHGIWQVDHGGGGEETRVVCGFIESSEMMSSPMFRLLPEVVIGRAADDAVGASLSHTVSDILKRVETASPGTEAMLSRAMELLFVEMLRRHASNLPEGTKGLLAALNDPVAGRALKLLHADPAKRWTAESLAKEAGSSRTVLGERFNALLGKPPIEYLTGWRIQLAADRLRNGRDGLARIAADIGYESEAAFNRAFKRVTGMTPGKWRDGAADAPPLMPLAFGQPWVG
jgi:AraC-like DNA-binding protein